MSLSYCDLKQVKGVICLLKEDHVEIGDQTKPQAACSLFTTILDFRLRRTDQEQPQPLGQLQVQATERQRVMPAVSHPMSVTLGAQVALAGYDLAPAGQALRAGQPLTLTLAWKSLAPASADYSVFVHLLDASGAVRAQKDSMPVDGTYPTTLWQPGEHVTDRYTLDLPADLPPGDYTLAAGLYLPETGQRLTTDKGDDRVVLTHLSSTR